MKTCAKHSGDSPVQSHPASIASDVSDYVVPDVGVKRARNGWQ